MYSSLSVVTLKWYQPLMCCLYSRRIMLSIPTLTYIVFFLVQQKCIQVLLISNHTDILIYHTLNTN